MSNAILNFDSILGYKPNALNVSAVNSGSPIRSYAPGVSSGDWQFGNLDLPVDINGDTFTQHSVSDINRIQEKFDAAGLSQSTIIMLGIAGFVAFMSLRK